MAYHPYHLVDEVLLHPVYVGYFFFQAPIGHDVKTTAKIRNI